MGMLIEWGSGEYFMVSDGGQAIIGRDSNVEVCLSSSKVSRHHAQVYQVGASWVLKDLGASNGTFVGGERIAEKELQETQTVVFGGKSGETLRFTVTGSRAGLPATLSGRGRLELEGAALVRDDQAPTQASRQVLPPHLKLGSGNDNDVVIRGAKVSHYHAAVSDNQRGGHDIVDLNSESGTLVNGIRISRRRTLRVGDIVSVSSWSRRYTGHAFEEVSATGGYAFSAEGLTLRSGSKVLVDNVTFQLMPRTLTAIVGPSGSGKSTLLSLLAAKQAPTTGRILFAGRDIYEHFAELRNRIGFVPQSDLLHLSLRTREALEYAAALRFPRDTPKDEMSGRVTEVLDLLHLSERADLPIDRLSGGQRKRTSVALELLTEPSLLFLDEPTSGLDPGLDRQVMNLLRELADGGRTVSVVTHSVANLDVCDEVVVMAPGGKLAYKGAPHGVLKHFGATDWAEVFDALNSAGVLRGQTTSATSVVYPAQDKPELAVIRQQPWIFQVGVLISRYLRVIASDRTYLAILIALPFILGSVGFATGSDAGLGAGDSTSLFFNPQSRSLLLVFILGASFMGIATSVQELVKERAIFERERSIGLSPGAYLFSKILVLGLIVLTQTSVFVSISMAGRGGPESGLILSSGLLEVTLVSSLLGVVSMLVGLVISSAVKTTDVTMPALVLATMAQVVFSGAVPLRSSSLIDILGIANPGYWAMNGLAAIIDIEALVGLAPDDLGSFWEASSGNLLLSLFALVMLALILIAATRFMITLRINSGNR
jgi:ABC-type multidrug transport system ATPase subunit/pSer/pThr/pTyr-binding forkhead associated (FHA) protein